MRRQLQDHVRVRRGKVKAHDLPAHGRISELHFEEDFGRIAASDGRDVYFHRNSVVDATFDGLTLGDEVRFAEEAGDAGPQASTVHLADAWLSGPGPWACGEYLFERLAEATRIRLMSPYTYLRWLSVAIGVLLLWSAGRVAAQPLGPVNAQAEQSQDAALRKAAATAFVLGNVEYLLVHEMAHLLLSEKDVPIIGPVENAADYIATLALLREEPLDPAQPDRALRFLSGAAEAFSESWRTGTALGADVPYWGAHALSIQRYYQIACLVYGSDPDTFADVPKAAGLPEARAEDCIAEYARADRAVEWLLASYGRRAGDAPGAATEIVYEAPPTAVSAAMLHELRSIELLERLTERLHERFTLERPLRLVMRSCGRAEATWMPERRELAVCYELVDTLYLLGLRAATGGAAFRGPSRP